MRSGVGVQLRFRSSLLPLILQLCCLSSSFLLMTTQALKVVVSKKPDSSFLDYHVVDANNNTLFIGGEIAFFVGGKWCVDTNETTKQQQAFNATSEYWNLSPQKRKNIEGSDKVLGSFEGEKVVWSCQISSNASVPIETTYMNMQSGEAVLFQVEWPKGAPNTKVVGSSYKSSLTNYPSLTVSKQHLPNALSWQGSFARSVRGFSEGTLGGPTVFFDGSDPGLGTVVVGSPWLGSIWKSFSAGDNSNWRGGSPYWSPGTSGRITRLPKSYRQTIMLYQQVGGNNNKRGGITATIDHWGQAMQQASKQQTGPWKLPDLTLEKIGYQTDNGAMYCFCQDRNCSHTLLQEIHYLKSLDIPIGYLSFQGAGASSGRGTAAPWCVELWGVDGGLSKQYPMDLTSFQKALGLPLQLYAPYFCPGSPYFQSRKFKSVPSDTSLPGCKQFAFENVQPSQSRSFYDSFLSRGKKKAGMISFETDFMNENYNCVPEFVEHATAAATWQEGMAGAALAKNISIQWCIASPTDMLASLDMPAVTNFRVSNDFCSGRSWDIGESSLLVWGLGAAPSKDTLWSTDNNRTAIPGCPWTPDHEESAAELHVVLALMSTGPVGISDAIGYTNTALLKRTITKDGTLLKPTKPITAVDSSFLSESVPLLASPAQKSDGGYVYGTAGVGNSWYFVSFLLPIGYVVKLRDFWPPIREDDDSVEYVLAYRHLGDGLECQNGGDAVASGCVRFAVVPSKDFLSEGVFEAPVASRTKQGQRSYIPTVTAVWQPCPISRWIMLGELSKYVPLSPRRFPTVECTGDGILAIVNGAPGEVVELTYLQPTDNGKKLQREGFSRTQYTVVRRRVEISRKQTTEVDMSPSFVDLMTSSVLPVA
jgi:hypothetical protein